MNRLKVLIIFLTLLIPVGGWCQDYRHITTSGNYIYGEGKAGSALQADRLALSYISEQLSIAVNSKISLQNDIRKSSGTIQSESTIKDIVSTYSSTTLTKCGKLVLENGPETYRILRYIHKEEIDRMFKAREQKILEMIGIAQRAEEEMKIDVAPKHYYWAQLLSKTLIYPNELFCDTPEGSQQVTLWLPLKINAILEGLTFEFGEYTSPEKVFATLYITHNHKPVTSLDYTYWDGVDWSAQTQAKDGLGSIELRANSNVSSINIKVEYSYEQELHIDPDLRAISEYLAPISYVKAYKNSIPLKRGRTATAKVPEVATTIEINNTRLIENIAEVTPYKTTVATIVKAIDSANYDLARECFTAEGFDIYTKLIKYGRAKTLGGSNFRPLDALDVMKFEESYFCRSIPMQFSFSGNKSFIENVVFVFNEDMKVSSLQFGLEKIAVDDILGKTKWNDDAKLVIINFLENYKTAFALARLDYLESIFSEDALIITGRVIKRTNVENQINLQNSEYIKYNRQTKGEYIANLRRSFQSKEYVNLRFSNLKVTKMGKGDKQVYCMEIKQDYYSSNYGDTGYLVLVVDVDDYQKPIIHVRTWQPQPDPEFGLFSPGDF